MSAVNAVVPLQTPEEMAAHLVRTSRPNLIQVANIKLDELVRLKAGLRGPKFRFPACAA
jgi:hypothetical protein